MTDYRAYGARTISSIQTVELTVAADSHDQAREKAEDLIGKHPTMWKAEYDESVSLLRWTISVEGVRDSGKSYMPESDRAERDATISVLWRAVHWLENLDEPSAALKLLDVYEEWETQEARENPWEDDEGGVLRTMFRDERGKHRARLLKLIVRKEGRLCATTPTTTPY
jgi:hypothetical protein